MTRGKKRRGRKAAKTRKARPAQQPAPEPEQPSAEEPPTPQPPPKPERPAARYRARAKAIVWARRAVQLACLCLFLWLLWAAGAGGGEQTPRWLRAFFDMDPLIMAATWLSARGVVATPVFALITLAVTILMGRVFCGWVCPLGTVHNAATWCRQASAKKRPARRGWSGWQRAKYFLLIALIVMAALGVHWIGVFDPIALLYRATTATLYPGAQYAIEDASTAVFLGDPRVGPLHLTSITEPVYRVFRDYVFVTERSAFNGASLIFLLFVAIVLLNFYRPRFWCRYVCPLGALLGLCSKRPALRLVSVGECTDCGLCARKCPAAADPDKPGAWRPTECFGCWNCVAECKQGAIDFKLASPLIPPTEARLDVSKRAMFAAGLGGLGGLLTMRMSPQSQQKEYNPSLIRPPGARPEREFLQRCLQCGACMKACPTNALQPAIMEAGIEGIWSPVLTPRVGYCEYECNACTQICPTEAIEPLSIEEKKEVKIGLAAFDTARCLPYAYSRECMVCEEHCPLPLKAIYFIPTEVRLRDGTTRTVKQPRVDPDLCTGCGVCEWACVFKDKPAIWVTSANESRHPDNQAILPDWSEPAAQSQGEDTGEEQPPYEESVSDPYGEQPSEEEASSDPYGS